MRVLALVLLLCTSATLLGVVRAEETVDDEAEDAGDDEDDDAPPPPEEPKDNGYTIESVGKTCPSPVKYCAKDTECKRALTESLPAWSSGAESGKAIWDSLSGESLGLFDKVSTCFREEMGKESQEIAKNIKCDWCGFLVEDIWETIIGAGRLIDAKKKSPNDAKDAARIAREFLDELCDDDFIHVAPSKYDVQPFKGPNGEKFRVVRDHIEDVAAAAQAKGWQMDVYHRACESYMMTIEMDFVEAIVDQMEAGKTEMDEFLYKYQQNSEEMKQAWQRLKAMALSVKKVACADLCKVKKKKKSKYKKGKVDYGTTATLSQKEKEEEDSGFSSQEFFVEGVPDLKGIRKHLAETMDEPLEKITVTKGDKPGVVRVTAPRQRGDLDLGALRKKPDMELNEEQMANLEKLSKELEEDDDDEDNKPAEADKDDL